jgi:hypothetical protein
MWAGVTRFAATCWTTAASRTCAPTSKSRPRRRCWTATSMLHRSQPQARRLRPPRSSLCTCAWGGASRPQNFWRTHGFRHCVKDARRPGADYPPAFWIDTVDLTFRSGPGQDPRAQQDALRRNPDVAAQPLRLDGDELNLGACWSTAKAPRSRWTATSWCWKTCPRATSAFELEIFTTCNPAKNTKLMGLYVSNDSFFTQCEAEGFRRITYFLDRPDVMASYTVTLRADKAKLPGAAVQRQPGGQRRWLDDGPPLRQVGRPAQEALLPVCPGGRPAGGARAAHHLARRQGAPAAGLRAPRRPGQDRARHELADGQPWPGTRPASACRWTWSAS